jgi:hypothetical protein
MKIYPIRLLKAVAYSGASVFIIFHEFGTNSLGADVRWRDTLSRWGESQSAFIEGLVSFLIFVVMVAALVYLVKGFYYFCSLNVEKNPVFENSLKTKFSKPCSGLDGNSSNIERMKQYRDAKLSIMENSLAAEEYKKTAWVDGLTMDGGKHTQTTKRFIDASLAAKTFEEGYLWLRK